MIMRNDVLNNNGSPELLTQKIREIFADYLKRHVDILKMEKQEFVDKFIFDLDGTGRGYISGINFAINMLESSIKDLLDKGIIYESSQRNKTKSKETT